MLKRIQNKKGDVPVMILVIGVFVVCGLAIASFFYSGNLFSDSFEGIGAMEKLNAEIEQGNLNSHSLEIKEKRFTFDFSSDFTKEIVVFSVNYFGP